MLPPARYRQLRGLVLHFRENWPRIRQARAFRRGIFGTFTPYGGTAGICRWCRLPTERRLRWHADCIDPYRAATGQSLHNIWGTANAPPCPCGQPARELDHQDALILAWTSGDPKRLRRAYALDNLTWLCTSCHAAKTRSDLAGLKDMRDRQVCLAGLIPMPAGDKSLGMTEWVLAEHGRIRNLQRENGRITAVNSLSIRRGPVTFDPTRTTCPRCLVAMERTEPSTIGSTRLPNGWHLDERPYLLENLIPFKHAPRAPHSPPTNQLALPFPERTEAHTPTSTTSTTTKGINPGLNKPQPPR